MITQSKDEFNSKIRAILLKVVIRNLMKMLKTPPLGGALYIEIYLLIYRM